MQWSEDFCCSCCFGYTYAEAMPSNLVNLPWSLILWNTSYMTRCPIYNYSYWWFVLFQDEGEGGLEPEGEGEVEGQGEVEIECEGELRDVDPDPVGEGEGERDQSSQEVEVADQREESEGKYMDSDEKGELKSRRRNVIESGSEENHYPDNEDDGVDQARSPR